MTYIRDTLSYLLWQKKCKPTNEREKMKVRIKKELGRKFPFKIGLYSAIIILTLSLEPLFTHPGQAKSERITSLHISVHEQKEILKKILKETGKYCDSLKAAMLHFFCEEKIYQEIYNPYLIVTPGQWSKIGVTVVPIQKDLSSMKPVGEPPSLLPLTITKTTIFGPESKSLMPRIKRKTFNYEYQLIQNKKEIEERRLVISRTGKVTERVARLKTRFYHKNVILGPYGLLGTYWQRYLRYRIIGKTILKNQPVIIIETSPRPETKIGHLWGKLWIREKDFGIMKIQWNQFSLKNYGEVLQYSRKLNAIPVLRFSSEYDLEKNHILFPSNYLMEEVYYNKKRDLYYLKSRIVVLYRAYRFFKVETSVEVKNLQ